MKKTFLIVLGILSSLVILEIALRIGGLVFLSLQDYRNYLSIRQKGTYRIICLGESTTAGQYPPFLEEILNQRNTGIKFSVIDRGVVGTNTSAILLRLEENLARYKPDMVVTMMGSNDKDTLYYKGIPEANTKLFQHCRVYKFIRLIYTHVFKKIKQAMELGIKDDSECVRLGRLYQHRGDLSEAEQLFKKAIELNPRNSEAYDGLGRMYRKSARLYEEEQLYRKAIELNPKNDWAFAVLGEVLCSKGKSAEAEQLYRKAIELNPKNNEAHNRLAMLYQNQGKFPEAEQLFKKAIENNLRDNYSHTGLIELYWREGKLFQVEEELKEFLKVSPGNEWAYRALESLYMEMGKPELAREYKKKREESEFSEYSSITPNNYHKLKVILDKRGIRLVCVQYPVRSVEPLKKIFEGEKGVIFVDNEEIFKDVLRKSARAEYFSDMFGGDFGHCTQKGNRLLAKNIADVILKEVFGR